MRYNLGEKVNKINENIFQIPISHFNGRVVNAYLIIDDRITLIDSGHIHESSIDFLRNSLRSLGYGFKDIDLIIYTHPHVDHVGGGLHICKENKKIVNIAHSEAASFFEDYSEFCNQFVRTSNEFISNNGQDAPLDWVRDSIKFFKKYHFVGPGKRLKIGWPVSEGDVLDLGKLKLQVLHTPSHSQWDICLYESSHKLLFTGDFLIIIGTSLMSSLTGSDIYSYRSSLKKVQKLSLDVSLPGHGKAINRPHKIIDSALDQSVLIEKKILDLLKEGKKTPHQIVMALFKDKVKDFILWYRYLWRVDTYVDILIREKKVLRMKENDNIYYSYNSSFH